MFSAFNPSKCTHLEQWTVRRPGSSRGLPAGAGIRTHNLELPWVSSPTLYPLGNDCPNAAAVWMLVRSQSREYFAKDPCTCAELL